MFVNREVKHVDYVPGSLRPVASVDTYPLTVPPVPTPLHVASYYSSCTMDPVRDLNNYLMGHPSGNLVPLLSWAFQEDGPDHQKTHYATAKCESVFRPVLEPCTESRSPGQGDWLRDGAFP